MRYIEGVFLKFELVGTPRIDLPTQYGDFGRCSPNIYPTIALKVPAGGENVMIRIRSISNLLCAIFLTVCSFHQTAALADTTTIAITGDVLPDGFGTIDIPLTPALNNNGQTVFPSFLEVSFDARIDTGVYFGSPSGDLLTKVVRENDLTPDATRRFSTVFLSPAFNDAGQMAFLGLMRPLNGGFSDDNGIFRGSGGALTQIVRQGQAAPDNDGTFGGMLGQTSTSFSSPSLNASGQAAFQANLESTANSTGIFVGSGGNLTQIVRQGQSPPDEDGTFFSFREPAINDAGQTAFTSILSGTTRASGVFRGSGGELTQIARTGQSAPDGQGTYSSFFTHNLNNAGQVAFLATLTGVQNRGVFVGSGGLLNQVARTGQNAPNGDGTFRSFLSLSLNDASQTTFVGTLNGTTHDTGLFLGEADGAIHTIAREGQTAPGGDGQFGDIITAAASLNNNGQAAFTGTITATNDGTDDEGIFVGDGIELVQVARQGQMLEGGTIFDLAALNNAGGLGGGSRRGLNDLGQVAFTARLDEGPNERKGVFLFTPPLHWRSIDDGEWDDSMNWTLSINPAQVHDVIISDTEEITVAGPGTPATVKTLSIGVGTGQGTLELRASGQLTTTEDLVMGPNGTLRIELDGALSDQFALADVLGTASLDGRLNLGFPSGFAPNAGDAFPIITADTRTGTFDQINGVLVEGGDIALAPIYDYQGNIGLTLIAALPGDADLDGQVDHDDLTIFFANNGNQGDWLNANFDGDLDVDLHDLEVILRNLGRTIPTPTALPTNAPIPIPGTATIVLLGVMACLKRPRIGRKGNEEGIRSGQRGVSLRMVLARTCSR